MSFTLIHFICTIAYVISAFLSWKWIHIAFSKGGRYDSLKLGGLEILFIIVPIVNTVFAIFIWMISSPVKDKKRPISQIINKFANRFFNIKS